MSLDVYRAHREFERFLFHGLPAPECDDFSPHPSPLECDDYAFHKPYKPPPRSHLEKPEGKLIATITYDHENKRVIIKRFDEE